MSATAPPLQVDLIVLDWDGGEALLNCLQSVNAQTRPPSRVLIVDNGSRLPVYQRLPKDLLQIPYSIIRNETNLGFTGGINRAMKEVTAPYVAWVNNDAVLAEAWLEKLLPAVSGEGKIAGAQSVVLLDKTTIDVAGISIDQGVFRPIGHGQKTAAMRTFAQPWGVSATAVLFRTQALNDVAMGGSILRSDFFAYYEDVELCARLRKRGWKFKLVPEPLAMHRGSFSGPRLGRAGLKMLVRNRYAVAKAHPGVGKVSALFTEDVTIALKDLLTGRFRLAATRLGGMIEGLRRK